ncbi:DUF4041 domain-containing protein [Macrococcoides bohemicum]|uniref:DUF4041 domain-containing protein n=1 Tax=Macrococcoides bohemicum TaxID=1903056 RepID=A0A328A7F6_9STAP|nr:DUF4041 domain-containing protein [Macrococcus bohemicus]RAK50442.1 DUF4041 domain-containing protein [Macrococcus bohemicus]
MKKFNMKEIFKISYKQSDYLKTLDNEDKKKFKKLPEDDKNRIVYEWLVETGQWDKEKVNDNQNRNAEIKTNINNNSITEPKKSGLYTFISIVIVISSLLTFAEPTFALLTLILVIMLLVKFIGVSKKDVEYIPDLYDVKHSIYNRQEENKVLQTDNETLEEKIHSNKNILIKIEKDIENKKHILNEITEQIKPKLEDYNFNLLYPINMFDDMSSYDIKNEINDLNMQEKRTSNVNEIINNTDIDNKKHAKNQLKQIITLFNVECEFLFNKLTSNNFDTTYNRIIKNFEQLNKLFETDGVHLEDSFLQIKLKKLELFHRLQIKLQEEAEIRKEERLRIAEEQKAERELEKKKNEIAKEQKQFNQEISKLMKYLASSSDEVQKQLYVDKINELNGKVEQLEEDKKDVENRLLNTRAGYVYVISNIGSFGEKVLKIGVTRRLEPMDRIKELGDASVPFEFDVHALIFSEDAPRLENILHNHFRDREVNKVNHRKEFFNVDLEEVEQVVKENHNNTVKFNKEPIAQQYRESMRYK